jgi:hypothetical protein
MISNRLKDMNRHSPYRYATTNTFTANGWQTEVKKAIVKRGGCD